MEQILKETNFNLPLSPREIRHSPVSNETRFIDGLQAI
jgi:hypothetical protein